MSAENLLAKLADIAEKEIGTEETPRGSNRGAALAKFFAADNYKPNAADDGYPWCASFVSWCVQQFATTKLARRWFPRLSVPRLSGAWSFEGWADQQGALLFGPDQARFGTVRWPQRGDIVTYTFSHVGIVAAASQEGARIFTAIEGNSNRAGSREGYGVVAHGRTFAQVRKFIRLTPEAEAAGPLPTPTTSPA